MATTEAGVQTAPITRRVGILAAPAPVLIAAALLLLVTALLPFVPGIRFYYLQVVILIFWFGTLGTAWTIIAGYGGMFSIGHAAFVGLGAYTSTLLFFHYEVSPWIGMGVGMALAAVLAVVVGYPAFRFGLRGDYFALATIAFGQIAFEVINGASGITRGGQGLPIRVLGDAPAQFQFADRTVYYFIAMAMWLITVAVAYRLRHSRLGFRLLALRDDEAAAERAGIPVTRVKLLAFAISAALSAAAGTFYAQFFLFIDPMAVLGINLSVQIILMAVLGGMASYLGGTLGALLLVPLAQFLAANLQVAGLDLFIYGVVLVLLMLFMPYGILGLLRKYPRWRKIIGW